MSRQTHITRLLARSPHTSSETNSSTILRNKIFHCYPFSVLVYITLIIQRENLKTKRFHFSNAPFHSFLWVLSGFCSVFGV
jgi:hypothetical protein